MIVRRLLLPFIGNEKTRSMLFGIYNVEGSSVIFIYGVRNVGKTAALKYLYEQMKERTEYIALDE